MVSGRCPRDVLLPVQNLLLSLAGDGWWGERLALVQMVVCNYNVGILSWGLVDDRSKWTSRPVGRAVHV